MNSKALIFSGYNFRAVLSLCRFFTEQGIPFALVASDKEDDIFKTIYKKQVIMIRQDKNLTIELFQQIRELFSETPVYMPTSEFLNTFILHNINKLESFGFQFPIAQAETYKMVTNKSTSEDLFVNKEIQKIPTMSLEQLSAPCVIKPRINILNGKTLYPIICHNTEELEKNLQQIHPEDYFFQKYVDGASYYFCGTLFDGNATGYWQENLLQQAGGKSIFFARSTTNPGVNEESILGVLKGLQYQGPFMIELIQAEEVFYFIELNPRFWGPLQLGIDFAPYFLTSFTEKYFNVTVSSTIQELNQNITVYYSFDAEVNMNSIRNYKIYPGYLTISNPEVIMADSDLYNKDDIYHYFKN
ncbi:hypothetical protein [Spirochaeta dissipatitropha]